MYEDEVAPHKQCPTESDLVSEADATCVAAAKLDFERHFGLSDQTKAYVDRVGHENVIVVENESKRAFYDMRIVIIKCFNLNGETE